MTDSRSSDLGGGGRQALTWEPHRLMLKKWKNFVPLAVKLGPFIKEPTLLRRLKSYVRLRLFLAEEKRQSL